MKDLITLKDISYSYGNKKVLNKLNLTISKGSFLSLIGISGAGKSLTLKLIASLVKTQEGTIENLPAKIGYAFQDSPLIPWLTIKDNLKICTNDFQELDSYLKIFKLETIALSFPNELSGGMIQKINILRSFLQKPDLILMDEPFIHIDSIQKEELHNFLFSLWNSFRPTIIFVTHDIDEAIKVSQTISLISKKTQNIIHTLDVSQINGANFLEIKNSEEYIKNFAIIYNHLKSEQEA